METIYCAFCESEAVSIVPGSGTLLCGTCETAYEFGLSLPETAEHVPEYLDQLESQAGVKLYFGDPLPLAGTGLFLEKKALALARTLPGRFSEFVDLQTGELRPWDRDRVIGMFLVQGYILEEKE